MSMQYELIPGPDLSRSAARQHAMTAARARADDAIGAITAKVETAEPEWTTKAVQALRKFANAQGGVFIIEHARLVLRAELPPVHDERIWGRVSRDAIAAGYIERVKGQYFPAASSNGAPKAVYRRGPKA